MTKPGERRKKLRKSEIRLLKLLSKSVRSGLNLMTAESGFAVMFNGRMHVFDRALVLNFLKLEYAARGSHTLRITRKGLEALQTHARSDDIQPGNSVAAPGMDRQQLRPEFNDGESPLYRLHRRRTADGRRYLEDHEYSAGEKLRKDFEIGQLQPRIASTLCITAGRSKGGRNPKAAEISDFAMDARDRFRDAIQALSPELADVAIDICCFLKGFEAVEREKQWPPRSAKLMLKTALAQLSRHYGFSPAATRAKGNIISWGDESYRPSIG